MYTGIIAGQAEITAIETAPSFMRYAIAFPPTWISCLQIGASVAVDGVCQTVVKIDGTTIWFEAIDETLQKTTLSTLSIGSRVNIERSLRLGDEIGGHQMAGHVVGCGTIALREENGQNLTLRISVEPEWMRYILPKGFIAVDGASLTVGDVESDGFYLHLIPETRRLTGLGNKKVNDQVNIELDAQTQAIVATVERYLFQAQGK